MDYCAIDFGTSNSAIALPPLRAGSDGLTPTPSPVRLARLEGEFRTMPTAVFYGVEDLAPHEAPRSHFGRAAVAAYVDGHEGRLMRSMKSILGSSLADQSTDVGVGRSVRYLDVVSGYLRRLKQLAETEHGAPLRRVVMGRPVHFVDDDAVRDAKAQSTLTQAAHDVGFDEVQFQFEPIAAALDHERTVTREELVLVADIGGGTSDFSLVRVGPRRRDAVDRRSDILGNHGVHVAGTDFDRHIELHAILPTCGYRGLGPTGREVPSRVYFDLATWHLINTVYAPGRTAELRRMRDFYAKPEHHARLMRALELRLGHALIAEAESAKIAVAQGGSASIDLSLLEPHLMAVLEEKAAVQALDADMERIVQAARDTVQQAGLAHHDVDTLYFTGGSTGFTPLADRISAAFAQAKAVRGDRFASVAQGLGVHAAKLWAVP